MFTFNFSEGKKSVEKEKGFVLPLTEIRPIETFSHLEADFDSYSVSSFTVKSLKRKALLKSLSSEEDSDIEKAEKNHSDLLPGVYEGGLKIWECTFDLSNYLVDDKNNVNFSGKTVLDLGCGAGVLGILALNLGADFVHFQDYNSGVISRLTIPNVFVNCSSVDKAKFWSGDWSQFRCPQLFNVILTSETIYNPDNNIKLLELLKDSLKPSGLIYLAGKSYYFGVGGSIGQFLDLIEEENVFQHRIVWCSEEGVKREIIEMRFK